MTDTDTASAPPRYRWLADELRAGIEQGRFADNQPLPSERDLSEHYDVSRDTVRKAVRYLEERGVIYSDHGRGTFVAPALVRRMSRFLDSFSQDTAGRGGEAGQKILLMENAVASMAMAGLLGIEPGHPLVRIKRLRTVDGAPVGVHDAYVVTRPGLTIDRPSLEKTGSLYKLLTQAGLAPAEAVENLSACAADNDDARALGVPAGSPLLMCERVTLSDRREPTEYCLMKYLPSYRYSTRLSRHGFQP